ncbi:MAG TPA: MaoC/PaaZ C-terminal domain-containing protein [Gemmatimonadaceae bacterium]
MNEYAVADVSVGMAQEFSVTVTTGMTTRFVEISNDVNPLHVDEHYADDKGFRDRVVHGMLTSAFYSTLVGVYLPGKYCLLQGIKITFHHPVFAGDHLKVRGEVTHVSEALRVMTVRGSITNQNGDTVSKAQIQVGFI